MDQRYSVLRRVYVDKKWFLRFCFGFDVDARVKWRRGMEKRAGSPYY